MSLHLYCVVPPGHEPHDVRGVDDRVVECVAADEVACWASAHDAQPRATADTVRAHDAVARAAMTRTVTPVPLRFGQWLEDAAAVRARIAADADRWTRLLASFAGHAEYGVRVVEDGSGARHAELDTARDVHAGAQHPGREYMATLARRQQAAAQRRAAAERIDAAFRERAGTVIRDARIETPAAHQGLVALAHLVAWSDVDAYHDVVGDVCSQFPALRFLRTGPWPPYSFVT